MRTHKKKGRERLFILNRIADWVEVTNKITGYLLSILIFFLTLVLIYGIITRSVFGAPSIWTTEMAQYIFIVYSIGAGAFILQRGEHVNVDILYSILPVRGRAFLDVLTSIFFFIFIGVLFYLSLEFTRDSISLLERSNTAWAPPIWPIKLVIPIAVGMIALQGCVKLFRDLCILFKASDS